MKLTILAAFAAFALMAQDKPAAKPEAAKNPVAAPETPVAVPTLQTAKFWRLFANAQAARQQANETPQAKAAIVAEEEFRKEQNTLQVVCGPKMELGIQKDAKADNSGDLICQAKLTQAPIDTEQHKEVK